MNIFLFSFSKAENVPKKESVYDFVDSDDDNLVVDESPSSNRRQKIETKRESFSDEVPSDSDSGPGPFRLRISCMYNFASIFIFC